MSDPAQGATDTGASAAEVPQGEGVPVAHVSGLGIAVVVGLSALIAVATTLAVALTIVVRGREGDTDAELFGAIVGQVLVFGSLAYLIRRFATKGKGLIGPAIASVLYLMVVVSDVGRQARFLGDLDSAANTLIQGATGAPPPGATADTLTLNYVAFRIASDSRDAWGRFNDALETIEDAWLSPATLSSADGRASTIRIVRDMRLAATDLGESIRAVIQSGGRRLETLAGVRPEYAAASRGYARGVASSSQRVDTFLRIEHEFLDAVEHMVNVANESQPTLSEDGTMLYFSEDRHVAEYNRWFAEVERLAMEEEKVLTEMQANNASIILMVDSLRNAIP